MKGLEVEDIQLPVVIEYHHLLNYPGDWRGRGIYESIVIRKNPWNINGVEGGHFLSHLYDDLLLDLCLTQGEWGDGGRDTPIGSICNVLEIILICCSSSYLAVFLHFFLHCKSAVVSELISMLKRYVHQCN